MEQYTIERVGVRSLAFLLGMMAFAWGILVTLVWIAVALGRGPFPGLPELAALIIGAPIGGLVLGAIAAILFNLAVVVVGGLEIELEQ